MTVDSENYSNGGNSSLQTQDPPPQEHIRKAGEVLRIFSRRHFSPYKVLVNREQRVVVVLNPKVGTTSFRELAARAYVEVLGAADPSDGRYQFLKKARSFPFARLGDYYHAFSHPQEYDFYCFVRNPYARLKSAWVDKFANGHESGYPRSIRGKLLTDIRHFAKNHHLGGGESKTLVPFATFLAYIRSQKDGKRNHHWDVQHEVLMTDVIRYSQVFKMETQFHEGMVTIFERLGVPEDWTAKAMEKPSNQSRKVKEAVFTPELARQAQDVYAQDFHVFDYDEDSWKGI